MPTINVYIDGFNLYYGCLKDTPYRWLDLEKLSTTLVPGRYSIQAIKYCTARVKALPHNPYVADRQDAYLRAVATIPNCSIHYGFFLVRVIKTEEKGSDVNLACQLVADAFGKKCDAALVISNDSDLLAPIRIAKNLGLRVGFAPPVLRKNRRPSNQLKNVIDFTRTIRRGILGNSQFPAELTDARGTFHKPASW